MSARLKWGQSSSIAKEELKEDATMSMTSEISGISFELARRNVDQSISLERKVIGYKQGLLASQSIKVN